MEIHNIDSLRKAQLVFSDYALHLNRLYTLLSLFALMTSGMTTLLQPYESDNDTTNRILTYSSLTLGVITTMIIGFLNFTKLHTNANKMEQLAKVLALYTSGAMNDKGLESLRREFINLINSTNFLWLRVPPLDFVHGESASDFKAPNVLSIPDNECLREYI